VTGLSDTNTTQSLYTDPKAIQKLLDLLNSEEFYDASSPLFHSIKHLGCPLPVRQGLPIYIATVSGNLF
jgi:hypothetical protein